ncbi:MAG: metallophosphatase family protein [Bacteroidales bacterium]|jgi:putative phosphoesterase|nr:metallophosphatase family protein [Bacteroidales bacterium]
MTKVGIMSDSHGIVPPKVYSFFENVDLILHAGDIGSADVLWELRNFKNTIAVRGNTDSIYDFGGVKEVEIFSIEQIKVVLTHIGGYPKHYQGNIKRLLTAEKPNLFICGHSHICKVMYDDDLSLLHINPGACGKSGIHKKCTLIRLDIDQRMMKNLELLEYDK